MRSVHQAHLLQVSLFSTGALHFSSGSLLEDRAGDEDGAGVSSLFSTGGRSCSRSIPDPTIVSFLCAASMGSGSGLKYDTQIPEFLMQAGIPFSVPPCHFQSALIVFQMANYHSTLTDFCAELWSRLYLCLVSRHIYLTTV